MLQLVSDWTIAELTERCAAALADRDAPDSGRVRAVPDERAIRYYTTLGLLDRPTLRGRTALYGPRHLAQLVAIKREQARGATLAEIQRTLPTLDDAALAALAGVELELGGGLRLSLTPDRPLTDADVAALHAAAAPLLAELARRHLVTPPEASP